MVPKNIQKGKNFLKTIGLVDVQNIGRTIALQSDQLMEAFQEMLERDLKRK